MLQVESAPDSPASKVMVGHQGPVWSVCCLDGGLCVSGGADKSILLWDLNGPRVSSPRDSQIFTCECIVKARGTSKERVPLL